MSPDLNTVHFFVHTHSTLTYVSLLRLSSGHHSLPLGGNPLQTSFWAPVVAKVAKKLSNWKKSFLSRGGRLTLILSVLNSIPIYYLSLFKMPRGIAESLEKISRNFLWDGPDGDTHCHLVAWDKVCTPKEKGGMGVANIMLRNKVLLGKWWWKFFVKNDKLWKRIIVSKYGLQENTWDAGLALNVTFRCPWKFISRVYPTFKQKVVIKVRGGNKVRFWEDSWWGEASFKDLFPSLFQLSTIHNRPISYFARFDSGTSDLSWDFHFRRDVKDEEIDKLSELLGVLDSVRLVEGVDDYIQWQGDPSGIFSVRSFYDSFFPLTGVSASIVSNVIWKTPVPKKLQIFSWIASLGKLPTSEMIQKRWTTIALRPNWCVLCRNDTETQDHILIHCPFTLSLWYRALQELRLVWVLPNSTNDLLCMNLGQQTGSRGRIFWYVVVQCICWTTWLERYRRVFEDIEETAANCWDKIKLNIALWIDNHHDFKNVSVLDLMRSWDYVYH